MMPLSSQEYSSTAHCSRGMVGRKMQLFTSPCCCTWPDAGVTTPWPPEDFLLRLKQTTQIAEWNASGPQIAALGRHHQLLSMLRGDLSLRGPAWHASVQLTKFCGPWRLTRDTETNEQRMQYATV